MKFLFVCAHEDDLEFSCANLINYLTQKHKVVDVLCMTRGEFGIFDPAFKGPRLARIRMHELKIAAGMNGVSSDHVYFADVIDGFLRFDREHVEKMFFWLNRLKPDIVFAPEPYFTYYWHSDHINAGRLVYYCVKCLRNRLLNPIQSIYYYTTLRPNFWWPFQDPTHGLQTLYQHKSQSWLLKWLKLFFPLEKRNNNPKKLGAWPWAEQYRRISLSRPDIRASFLFRGFINALSQTHIVNPPPNHFIVPDIESSFGKQLTSLRKQYHFDR
jgi:LmbE family N-acetylglucosaminyl deacetylase